MCSISGFIVTQKTPAHWQHIVASYSKILERGSERGRDSAGVVGLDIEGTFRRQRRISPKCYDFVSDVITQDCSVLIGNNRAEPTTEFVLEKTKEDAQPFGYETIFVSHNGTIANDLELKETHELTSETRIDSSILPSLVHRLGIRDALNHIQGSFALAIIDTRHPHKLWLARNYKPLFLKIEPSLGALFFASRAEYLAPGQGVKAQLQLPAIVPVPPYHLVEIDGLTGEISEEDLSPRGQCQKVLVICSGGLDSTTVAKWAQIQGYEVTLLHFLYNCRAQEKEMEAIRKIAHTLQCGYRFESLEWLGKLGGSSLTDTSIPITENEVSAEFAHEWVPARNLIFCALAAGLCDRHNYDTLILGLNLEEGGAYPDNTVEFYEALDHVCNIGTMSRPKIISPIGNLVKHQIVQMALDIDAPIHLSWSCYYGEEKHCGHCGPCFMRRTAFRMLGIEDPIEYKN